MKALNYIPASSMNHVLQCLWLSEGFDYREPNGRESFGSFRHHYPVIPCHSAPRCRAFKGAGFFFGFLERSGFNGPELRAGIITNGEVRYVPVTSVILDVPEDTIWTPLNFELPKTPEEYLQYLLEIGFPFEVVDLDSFADSERVFFNKKMPELYAWALTKVDTPKEALCLAQHVWDKKYHKHGGPCGDEWSPAE